MAQQNNAFGLASLFDPSVAVDQAALDRQMALAAALRQQSLDPVQVNGRQIGGMGYAISPWEGVAKLVQAWAAKRTDEKNDKSRQTLAEKTMQAYANALRGGDPVTGGAPASGGPSLTPQDAQATMAAPQPSANPLDPGAQPGPTTANLQSAVPTGPAQSQAPAQGGMFPSSGQFSLPALLRGAVIEQLGGTPMASAYAKNFETPEAVRTATFASGGDSGAAQRLMRAKMLKEGTIEYQPGNVSKDLSTGQMYVAPDFKTGVAGGIDPTTGKPFMSRIAGSEVLPQIAGETKGAEAAATLPYQPPTVVNAPGGPRLMTPAQQIQAATGAAPGASLATALRAAPQTQIPPEVQASRDAGRVQILKDELAKEPPGSPASVAIRKELSGMNAPGFELEKPERAAYRTGSTAKVVDYEDSLNKKAQDLSAVRFDVDRAESFMPQFKQGGGQEKYMELAKVAQAIPGVPQSVVDGIARGNLGAAETFDKIMAKQVLLDLKQMVQGGGGRILKTEFDALSKRYPNPDTDPRAIKEMFQMIKDEHGRTIAEQTAFNQYKDSGQPLDQWQAQWQSQQAKKFNTPSAAPTSAPTPQAAAPQVVRTGTHNGRRVQQLSDGTVKYAD